jgi:hypothetical protein
VIANSAIDFATTDEAAEFIQNTAAFLVENYSSEGVCLIEHLLLRPSVPTDEGLDGADPYSFQITLLFPSGYERDFSVANAPANTGLPHRFRQKDLRSYVDTLIRQECPAHIISQVFWLDVDTGPGGPDTPSFNNAEACYTAWLEHFVAGTLTSPAGEAARVRLVNLLGVIDNLYA